MPKFDWNGNGKSDAFDNYMDMKAISNESNNGSSDLGSDILGDNDTIEDMDVRNAAINSSIRRSYSRTISSAQKTDMSFQDELKQNMRTPEVVKTENAERASRAGMWAAEQKLKTIKESLFYNVKNAEYITHNGVTTVSCICDIDYRYLRTRRETNSDQLRENNQRFVLFRDPTLKYQSWEIFDVQPKYNNEYYQLITALKQIAAKENINIECVIYNLKSNEVYPFPTKMQTTYVSYRLGVRASTIIPSNNGTQVNESSSIETQTTEPKDDLNRSSNESRNLSGISMGGKPLYDASKDSNGVTILKCFLVTALCIGGIALPVAAEMGPIGTLLCIFGGVGLSILLLKNS